MRVTGTALLAAIVVVAAALFTAAAPVGDPSVARTLLESGKKALNARKIDEAVVHFRKALAEDGTLVEAAYWIGMARDKDKDDAGALAAYREFLVLLDARGSPSADEAKLKAAAEKRVDVLGAAEREFQKLEDKYIEDLLGFARAKFLRDPAVASMALDRVLAVRPNHPAAQSLYDKIGGKPGAKPGEKAGAEAGTPPAARGVAKWRDLLADRQLKTDAITYADGLMIVDTKGGQKLTASKPIDEGKNLVYEMEFRVAETYESGWLTGLTFAENGDAFVSFFARSGQAILVNAIAKGERKDLAQVAIPTLDLKAWHRLSVVLRGDTVEGWLDGKKVVEEKIPDRADLGGELGIFQQGCRTERRVFRAGKL